MKYSISLLSMLYLFIKVAFAQAPIIIPKSGSIILQLDIRGKYQVLLPDIATVTTRNGTSPQITFSPASFGCNDLGKKTVTVKVTEILNKPPKPATVSFSYPDGVIFDSKGNLFIAEDGHDIRKIDTSGQVTTFAGSNEVGYVDGSANLARFNSIIGIVVDASDNLYVTDAGNNRIRKISPTGIVTTIAGTSYSGSTNGAANVATFDSPTGIAIDLAGNLYISDNGNNIIRKISTNGFITTIAGSGVAGYVDGKGTGARFNSPNGLCIDAAGNIYVADGNNFRIRKISIDGIVSTLAGNGVPVVIDGFGTSASLTNPNGIAIDASNNLYVGNEVLRKISPSGQVTTIAGSGRVGSVDGIGTNASFSTIEGICFDSNGVIYLADFSNNKIRTICPNNGQVSTLAGSGIYGVDNGNIGVLQSCAVSAELTIPVTVSDSLGICNLKPLIIANTFTPNFDGINDVWNIPELASDPDCTVSIYNRYGQLIFQSHGYSKPWDGTMKGKPIPVGTYYYLITLSQSKKAFSGNITVLK